MVIFDLHSFYLALKNMHGPLSYGRINGTMFGEVPRVHLRNVDGRITLFTTERETPSYGYHSVEYLLLSDNNFACRTDSQAKASFPTFEIHTHHPDKSGVPAQILELGFQAAMDILNKSLQIAKNCIPKLPSKFTLAFAELDYGLAETNACKTIWGQNVAVLRERYHSMKIGKEFHIDMVKEGLLTDTDCFSGNNILNDYFKAKSEVLANQKIKEYKSFFFEKVDQCGFPASKVSKLKTRFHGSFDGCIFKNSREVCDFGRMRAQTILASTGPIIENLNRQVKARIGKRDA